MNIQISTFMFESLESCELVQAFRLALYTNMSIHTSSNMIPVWRRDGGYLGQVSDLQRWEERENKKVCVIVKCRIGAFVSERTA